MVLYLRCEEGVEQH